MNTSSSCQEAVCHDRRAKCSVLANLSSVQQLILSAVSLALIRSCSFRCRPTMVRNNERCRLLRSSAVYHQRIDVVLLMKTIVHHHVVAAAIRKPPSDWKLPPRRPVPTTRGSKPLNRIWDLWTSVFLCVEESSLSRILAFDCEHGYAQ